MARVAHGALPKSTPAQEAAYWKRVYDVNRECDVCGWEMVDHRLASVVATRRPRFVCPPERAEAGAR